MVNTYNLYLNRFLGDLIPVVPLIGVLLVSNNLTLSTISLVFFTLSASVMVLEIPGGIFADRVSLKYVLVFSRLLKLLAFTVIFIEPTFAGFILGAILWGGASALDSGAFQAYVFCFTRQTSEPLGFDHIYARSMTASMVGLLAASGVATTVGLIGFYGLHLIGLTTLVLCFISTLFLPHVTRVITEEEHKNSSFKGSIISAMKYIGLRPTLLAVMIVGVFAGAIKGSLDEYTSLLLLETGALITAVGIMIFALEVLKTGSAAISPYVSLPPLRQVVVLGLLGLCFTAIGFFPLTYFVFMLLVVVVVIDATLWMHNDSYIQKKANDSNRATIASFKNFFTESLSLIVFLFVWLFGTSLDVSSLYAALGLLMVLASLMLIIHYLRKHS